MSYTDFILFHFLPNLRNLRTTLIVENIDFSIACAYLARANRAESHEPAPIKSILANSADVRRGRTNCDFPECPGWQGDNLMTDFQELATDVAIDLACTGSAFKGDFGDWLVGEISRDNAKTYLAQLPPVKMHRKFGLIKTKTRFMFAHSTRHGVQLRFKDTLMPPKCTLDEMGEQAIVLVTQGTPTEGLSVEVDASGSGKIIDTKVAEGQAGKSIFIWCFKVIDPAEMVGWYDPGQLAQTAVQVAISTIFGRNADYRTTEALAVPEPDDAAGSVALEPTAEGYFDYSATDKLWMDYIADTGDGWHSTYSVAYYVAQPELKVPGVEESMPRGEILIFGGDEVYPTSSRPVYRQRL